MRKIYALIIIMFLFLNGKAETQQRRSDLNNEKRGNTESLIKSNQDSIKVLQESLNSILSKSKLDTNQIKNLYSKLNNLLNSNIQLHEQYSKDNGDQDSNESQSNFLSLAILIFGGVMIIAILFFKPNTEIISNLNPLKLVGIMFIGVITVFLIPAGFSNNQITPIIGLLGTLAGYLVGSTSSK